jgi:hypothetical protein
VVQSDTAGGVPIGSPCSNIIQISSTAELCNVRHAVHVCTLFVAWVKVFKNVRITIFLFNVLLTAHRDISVQ